MTHGNKSEIHLFQEFISERIRQGDNSISPEDLLWIWREEHPLPETEEDELEAIRVALEAYDKGDRGIPLEDLLERYPELKKAERP